MHKLPLTPHIEGVLDKTKELAGILKRDGADIDLFFHCFLNDLGQSCSSIFKKLNVDPRDLIKESRSVLNKKKKNKHTKKVLKTDVRKLLQEAEDISIENFKLDYIPPEIILMTFFDKSHYPKVIKNIYPKGEEYSDEIFLGFITECSLIIKDFDSEEFSSFMDVETPEDWIDMFDENEILSQFAENLNLKALNKESYIFC